jgi:NADH:ubiquinone reductase (H+-translocating)
MKQKILKEEKNIVILGGGFAGIRAVLDLNNYLSDREEYQIILVDRKEYQTYQPALYEAATAQHGLVEARKVKRSVTIPFSKIFAKTRVKIFQGFVERLDLENGLVVTDSRIINYNYLLIALGCVSDYSTAPGVEKYSFGLKSLEEAIMIRNRIEDVVTKKDKGTIIIAGGGFTGIEFAGELYNLLKHECETHGKTLEKFQIVIVDGSTSLSVGSSEKLSSLIFKRLNDIGVIFKFSSLITEAGADYVVLNMKERQDCDLLVWCAGVRFAPIAINPSVDRDKKDRLLASDYLSLQKYSNVFVAGDGLCFQDPQTKKQVGQNYIEARKQGALAAKNIFRMIKARQPLVYIPRTNRYIIPLIGKFAYYYTPNIMISGFFGWLIKRVSDLRYFVSILPFLKALRFWLFENKIFTKND